MQNNNIFDRIKDEVSITEVAADFGVEVTGNKALCSFHKEKKSSLTIYPETNSFFCFGCGAGGSVIDFYMSHDDCDVLTASKKLAEDYNIPWQYDETIEDRLKRKEEEALQKDLEGLVKRWHSNLREEDIEHLKKRGLTEEFIRAMQIGYEPNEWPEEPDVAKKLGLISENGRYLAAKSIVIPFKMYGKVALPVFYRPGQKLKYIMPSGWKKPLIGADRIYRNPELYLAEGVFDYLCLIQFGFPALCPVGTRLNENQKKQLSRASRVMVAFDGDEAGKAAGLELCREFFPKARMLELPDGKDINDLLVENPEVFTDKVKELRAKSKDILYYEVEKITTLPEWECLEALKSLYPYLDKLDQVAQRDFFDKHIKALGITSFKVLSDSLQEYVSKIALKGSAAGEAAQMSEEEKRQAEELLQAPDILGRFIESTEKIGHVGEEVNKKYLFLACTSRKLHHPISTVIKGESSSGKSYLVDTVTAFFPEEDIYQYTKITANVLYYTRKDFKHKMLVIMEGSGSEESDYSIRSFISEGSLRVSCTVKNQNTGHFEEMDKVVEGPMGYIETTTKTAIHDENATRVFDIYVDDSEKQTKLILDAERRRAVQGDAAESGRGFVLRTFKNAQRLIKPHKVIIPFADKITFPTGRLRVRRDFKRFLALIEASTILHQRQREVEVKDGVNYLIATIEDYAVAYEIAEVILVQTLKDISPKAELVAKAAEKLFQGSDALTRKDFYAALPDMSATSIDRCLDELVKIGCLERAGGGKGRGNAITYSKLKGLEHVQLSIPSPEDIEASMKGIGWSAEEGSKGGYEVGNLTFTDQTL